MSRHPTSWLLWLLSCLEIQEFVAPSFAVSFNYVKGTDSMPTALLGTVTAAPSNPSLPIVKRTVTVADNGGTALVLDATAGPVTFPCNTGDSLIITLVDTSAGGVSSSAASQTVVAHDTVTIPVTPTFAVSFAPAPVPVTPTPAPAAS
jgi:hypothetical protein